MLLTPEEIEQLLKKFAARQHTITKTSDSCVCGSSKVGSPNHSDYCPARFLGKTSKAKTHSFHIKTSKAGLHYWACATCGLEVFKDSNGDYIFTKDCI